MPSSAAVEMNFTGQNSKPGAENFQFDDCYIPMTPLKPCLLKSRPICEQRQEHWFSEEESLFSNGLAHAYGVPACCEPSNSIDETNCFRAFGENHISHDPPIGPSGVQSGHFRSLLALANVGAAKEAEKTAAKSGSFLPIYRTQLDGSRYEASSTTSSPAKQDYGLNLWSNSSCAQDIRPLYGSSMYDVNSPPNTSMNAFKSQNMPSQLAPITPDHQFRIVENTNDLPILRLDGTIDQVTIASEKLKENHNPDKGHGPEIDLNHTPQQKPRRRKHRPKVVIEGKPKRTPKPETPKPQNPTNKRKYVRKVKLGEAPAGEKSCKRALNFSLEGEAREGNNACPELQAQNYSSRVESKLLVQLGEGIEISLEKTQMGVAYDLTRSTNKLLEEYLALPERREMNSGNPHTAPLERDSKIDVLNNHARGKCQTVLSDETHDKQVSNTTVKGITETRQAMGLKRGRLQNDDAGPICQNTNGGHYSSLHAYPAMFSENSNNGMYFPMIYKKKRSEKVHCSTMPSTAHAAEYTSCGVASTINSCGEELSCKCGLGLDQKGKTKKKRSKGPTRVRDFTSLMGIVGYGQVPYFPTERAPTPVSVDMQKYKTLNHPPTSIEALIAETRATMKKKKRFKRLSFTTSTSTGAIQMRPSTVEEITELLERLDINSASNRFRRQERMALVPFNFRFEDQKALVLYQKDRSVAPFEGMFNPIQKRRPRPKVDIDEETNRVWNLLLENINNEGIDGTDEEKAKWWEDERRVFQGRADSFISRMHLVQGDRRFSPWKGSVLDSVVGVFLTQNVSDHLSSSAFMSLAARFPLNSTSSSRPHDEGTSIAAKEPEVYMTPDPEDTNTEVVSSNSPLGTSSSTEKSVNNSLEIFGNGSEFKGPTESSVGEREMDNALSAQFSAGSSEDSVDFSVAQDSGKLEACLRDNEEALLGTRSNSNDVIVPSFVALLQMAEISQGPGASRVESFEISGAENCRSEPSGVTTESVTQVLIQENETASNSLVGLPTDNVQSERESTNLINITTNTKQKEVESSLNAVNARSSNSSKPRVKSGNPKPSKVNWDSLRLRALAEGKRRERQANTMDSLDWEAVRCADVSEIADTIKERGMNNLLAERIKDFLNRLVKEHGTTDLEWLRDVPPDQAKEYLLSVRGLGLKSVECVRLLTLHHLAFPVDTNVGRIAVRLGWVPLQPLPESLQLHLLELYPVLESIQRYLWPRLCKLDQKTLYELHYQMITFGKVFCTKSKPNCNACPLRGECRHFASAFASARLGLPGPEEKSIVSVRENKTTFENPVEIINHLQLPFPPSDQQLQAQSRLPCVPLVEVPASPEPTIEIPLTPESEALSQIPDIEDAFSEDPEEIPTIKLNIEEFTQNLQNYMHQKMELQEFDVSKALVALTPDAASIPIPKLKNVNRLRTEHHVYELPDSHPLLEGLDRREPDDPCSYLLAIWTPGETANSITPPEGKCSAQDFGMLCNEMTCFSCNSVREANSQTVRGTLLIPCRTAMRGSFPLNGTYFQVNEVFADHDSSMNPIDVPRAWIWNLPRRTVYFGTSIPSIFKGLSTEAIQYCFWRGFVCLRGFDQKSRAPRPLMARLHFPASKLTRSQGKPTDRHQ